MMLKVQMVTVNIISPRNPFILEFSARLFQLKDPKKYFCSSIDYLKETNKNVTKRP